jgi:hypothetical protein
VVVLGIAPAAGLLALPDDARTPDAEPRRALRSAAPHDRPHATMQRTIRTSAARRPRTAKQVICRVFRGDCRDALRVAHCESRFRTDAVNGQYLGLFQMGSTARSLYGHGSSAPVQVRAAYRYFVDSGRDWSPWSCRP